ncbi:MAG: hypothetical protein PHI98_01550 [Eubacteriales bacterium]|nr:hypothetical protein [Eubacteriales bacterium]
MKEMNGTLTLAFVEEDNKQRVIFRVFPLCTREGAAFHGGMEDFPDEGSLRVVPDKREQSTFKDRMRAIGGLCVICLISDGKDLVKVRQNRNYAPEQGEMNKLAIYSDVICEFVDDSCFEVLELGADASGALTEKVLLYKDKVLYGPVERANAASAAIENLRPFGNDRFLLHTIETPALGKHQIYWDPEATLTWRQRRNALRRKERTVEGEQPDKEEILEEIEKEGPTQATESQPTAIKPARAPKAPVAQKPTVTETAVIAQEPKVIRPSTPTPRSRRDRNVAASALSNESVSSAPVAETKPVEVKENEAPSVLPIGAKLDILDTDLSFDEQISRLDQSLSSGANRLSTEILAQEPEEEEEPEVVNAHFTGTPLVSSVKPITRSASKPESVHHVVERQLLTRDDNGSDTTVNHMMDNPIDSLRTNLDYVWQNVDMRMQAIDVLCDNETFMRDMLQVFRRRGLNTQGTAAAQEQLAEIEAERISLLMQLDMAKANEKKYREEALAALTTKVRAESERLKRDVKGLEAKKAQLTENLQAVSGEVSNQIIAYMSKNIQCMSGVSENRILLSPVVGQHYAAQELAEKLRVHMNESGYAINEDDAMGLLVYFAINDAICLNAKTETDAARFAQVMLESFGLQSVAGFILPESYVEVVSLLPEDEQRTPTVTVQELGTESMSIYGHKTIFLMRSQNEMLPETISACPVINVPLATRRAFGRNDVWEAVKPASISSFAEIRANAHPMQDEAEKWFGELKQELQKTEMELPDAMLVDMRRYIEVATRKIRGGFLAAADSAVCHWIVPAIRLRHFDPNRLSVVLAGLPKTMEMLGL